jgi:hypothetical protein
LCRQDRIDASGEGLHQRRNMRPVWGPHKRAQTERIVTMANAAIAHTAEAHGYPEADAHSPAYQAYQILHWGFVAAPVIAGADKFLHLLTNWDQYLAPTLARMSPLGTHGTMLVVGVVEVVAGLVVAVKPRIGAYVVAAWLVGIILNLLLLGSFFDVALRDFGLFLGALALGRLSQVYDAGPLFKRGAP